MSDEHFALLLLKVAGLVIIMCFAPQIMRGLRRLGYRSESEADTVSWKRGAALFGIALALSTIGVLSSLK